MYLHLSFSQYEPLSFLNHTVL